jgi:ligand-binding sensor domain-containing protein
MLAGTCRVWQIGTSGSAPLQLSNDFDTLGTGACTGDETNLVNALAAGGPIANGNSTVVYAVTNGYGPLSGSPGGEVWVTTSAGVTLMTNVTQNANQNVNPNGYAISTVAMDSSDATGNTAYVGIMGFSTPGFPTSHVWKTTNAGTSWTDWTGAGATELPDNPVNALLVDAQAGQVYAGTDVGVFVSATTAPGWTEVGPVPGPGVSGFLPNAPVTALQLFNPDAVTKTLVASTYGRGIWNYPLVTAQTLRLR